MGISLNGSVNVFKDLSLLFLLRTLEGRQKEQRSNNCNEEVIPYNMEIIYQGNAYILLDRYGTFDEEHPVKENIQEVKRQLETQITPPDLMN